MTKNIIAFKSFFISLCWALLVLFLVTYYSLPISIQVILLGIFIYFRLFIHEEIFNIKDIKRDKIENLLTFAIFLDKEKLLGLLNIINFLSIMPIIFGVYLDLFPPHSITLILLLPYTFCLLRKLTSVKINQKFLYYIIADGEMLFWSVFTSTIKVFIK